MEKTKKILKIVGIVLLSILFMLAIVLDIWFIYVKYHAPEKVSSKTYEVGYQVTTGGDKKAFIEVNYKSNDEKNGYELFDIKYNYMLDENQDRFYSQGLQYVGIDSNIDWSFVKDGRREPEDKSKLVKESSGFISVCKYHFHNWFGNFRAKSGVGQFNYASADNYSTTNISTNPINDSTKFKIQIGDDLYLMKFKGKKKIVEDYNFVTREQADYQNNFLVVNFHYNDYYAYEDYNFFSRLLFNAVKGMERGTSQDIIFEFGDMFNFYKWDPNAQVYTDNNASTSVDEDELTWFGKLFKRVVDTQKVIEDLKSYYVITVNVSADGAKMATDSIFNAVAGKSNFNTTGSYITDDYFYGRRVKHVTLDDFTFVDTSTINTFKLCLSDKFIKDNIDNKKYIVLKVEIDLDKLSQLNFSFAGFTDNAFNEFDVYKIFTIKDGTATEVNLW